MPIIRPGEVTLLFRKEFASETFIRDYDKVSRYFTRSQLFVQTEDGQAVYTGGTHLLTCPTTTHVGELDIRIERSEAIHKSMEIHWSGPGALLYVVRSELITPELAHAFNVFSPPAPAVIQRPVPWATVTPPTPSPIQPRPEGRR